MKQVLSVLCLAMLLSSVVGYDAHAQTDEPRPSSADDTLSTLASTRELERYDGLEIGEVKSEPSGFGLFLRDIRDLISIGLTFDPVEKAEKRLQAAEWRNQVAQRILESNADEMARERATKLLDASSEFIERIESSSEIWAQRADKRVNKLVRNIATYNFRKEKILDRIEERIPEDRRGEFDTIREQATDQHRRLENAIENIRIPEDLRAHLSLIKTRIEERAANREAFIEERKTLQEQIDSGDPDAREALMELQQKRKTELRKRQVEEVRE